MDEIHDSPEAWARVAREVKRRRIQLEMTQPQVHAAGGPSVSMLSKIEGAKQQGYEDMALARLEKALQWESGSIEAIRNGQPPTPLTAQHDEPARAEKSSTPLAVDPTTAAINAGMEAIQRILAARDTEIAQKIAEQSETIAQQSREIAQLRKDLRRLSVQGDQDTADQEGRESA
ncbi:hypothetical protein IMZ11_02820 [Microtetraspora sp. AC03309]|uniref:hypothetical protein n=1 Tax=Microtetraspora sp. AC03309 TaxID=2779376 RepID=UPI001E43F2A3|nr:hypothetical protein [Microtetraspora sp. AC03309]MCC5574573.1 hypothetical protein [Microtetraspora sp. AC03309]